MGCLGVTTWAQDLNDRFLGERGDQSHHVGHPWLSIVYLFLPTNARHKKDKSIKAPLKFFGFSSLSFSNPLYSTTVTMSAHPFDQTEPFNVYDDSDTDSITEDFQSMALSEMQYTSPPSWEMDHSLQPKLPAYALRRRNAIVGELPDAPSRSSN